MVMLCEGQAASPLNWRARGEEKGSEKGKEVVRKGSQGAIRKVTEKSLSRMGTYVSWAPDG